MMALLANAVAPSDSTLCGSEPVQVHVTVAPTAMVSTAGFWLPLWPLTNWMPGPTVTVPTAPPPPPPEVPVPLLLPQPASDARAIVPITTLSKRIRSSSARRRAGAGLFPVDEQEPAGRRPSAPGPGRTHLP